MNPLDQRSGKGRVAADRESSDRRSTSQETYRRLKLFSPRGRRAAVVPCSPRIGTVPRSCLSEGFLRAAPTATPAGAGRARGPMFPKGAIRCDVYLVSG